MESALLTTLRGYEKNSLKNPGQDVFLINGNIDYYHYGCNDFDDRGWGCGYRTLQSIVSWGVFLSKATRVPSIRDIQEALVDMQDKPADFVGSKEWIGSFEVSICMDYFTQIPCKILHVPKGKDLINYMNAIQEHFKGAGSPVMMGGDCDNSSKGILGVCIDNPSLLVMDPHYYGKVPNKEILHAKKYVAWKPIQSFMAESFYNICLPQI